MSTSLTEDERDLITAWITAKRPDRIHAMRTVEADAQAWLEDGDRHAYRYDPHSYEAAGTMHIGPSLEEQRLRERAQHRRVALAIVLGFILAASLIAVLIPRTLGMIDGELTTSRALWYPNGACLEHETTGELACAVVKGGK